jgi:carbamoyl-phosphate synthase large subunit
MQHIEDAGITRRLVRLPPYHLEAQVEQMRNTPAPSPRNQVVGLINVQYAIRHDVVYVLEVNPRVADRSFVSKTTGVSLASLAAAVMVEDPRRTQHSRTTWSTTSRSRKRSSPSTNCGVD